MVDIIFLLALPCLCHNVDKIIHREDVSGCGDDDLVILSRLRGLFYCKGSVRHLSLSLPVLEPTPAVV